MKVSQLLLLVPTLLSATGSLAFPEFARGMGGGGFSLEGRDVDDAEVEAAGRPGFGGQQGRTIEIPPRPTGSLPTKRIPDAAHPYRAPRKGDKRGPCPGMNSLANHGYLPRDGVASFAQIVSGTVEGYNMAYEMAAGIAAFTILTRGNPLIDLVSIGGPSPRVPALAGRPDGSPGGAAKHGRFEADMSMMFDDYYVTGDANTFRPWRFKKWEELTRKYSDGNIINLKTMQELKWWNYQHSQKNNRKFLIRPVRAALAYNEAAFVLKFFANGTTETTSLSTARSFFEKGKFPDNWYRAPRTFGLPDIIEVNGQIVSAHPIAPGHNAPNGTFVLTDTSGLTPGLCGVYKGLLDEIPAVLLTTTGATRRNVDVYLHIMHELFAECPYEPPTGASEA